MEHLPVLARCEQDKHGDLPRAGQARGVVAVPPASADADRLATSLMQRQPGSLVWFGSRTRRWWAFAKVHGAWTLLEMQTADQMAQALMTAEVTAE
jgi:hypothetical protein